MNVNASTPADVIAEALTLHLGPSAARTAVRAVSTRLGLRPGEVSVQDAPRLLEALRPVLRTLLGPQLADAVLDGIRGELH